MTKATFTILVRPRALQLLAALALVLSGDAAVAATDQQIRDDIARRSFGGGEALAIAQRSLAAPQTPRAVPRSRVVPSASRASRVRSAGHLDAAMLERTDRYRVLIEHHSRLNHVDADLVQAMVYTESGGDALAVSPAGARGLMQLMPATARSLGVTDPLNPEQSIASGIHYLRDLLDRFGSMELALWAYNAGPGAVQRGVLPAETEAYVPRVLGVRRALKTRAEAGGQLQ